MMPSNPVEILFLIVCIAALGLLALDFFRERIQGHRLRKRVSKLNGNGENGKVEPISTRNLVARRLSAAGVPMNATVFLLIAVLLSLAAGLFVLEFFERSLFPSVLAFGLVLYVLLGIVRDLGRFRSVRFEEKLVDAVDLFGSALKGGENPTQALAMTADSSVEPVRRELEEVLNRLRLGMSIRRALGRLPERYDSEGVRLFTSALAAKWSAGGDLAPALLAVNRIMRERLRHRLHLRSQLAGAQLSSILVAIAPYLLLFVFYVRQPDWMGRLFTHPAGPPLLFIAVCLQVIGFLWLNRITKVEL